MREFATHVYHVHGKDTEIDTDNVYEYGTEQPPTFGKPPGFGSMVWRYAIPGHGCVRWIEAFRLLSEAGFKGAVTVELEDGNFNGSEAGEKQGILAAARNLATF